MVRPRRDKNPTFQTTCVICRNKITINIKLTGFKTKTSCGDPLLREKLMSDSDPCDVWRLKALFIESFCMAFGFPVNHPFVSVFINKTNVVNSGRLCHRCFEDVGTIHHIFWQLHNLENKLVQLQNRFSKRLRCNYESIPVATMCSRMGVDDILHNLENLTFDEIVKVLFEKIRDDKELWPKALYSSRWKEACDNAKKIALELKDVPLESSVDAVADQTMTEDIVNENTEAAAMFPLTEDHDYLNVSHTRPPKRASSAKLDDILKAEMEIAENETEISLNDDGEFFENVQEGQADDANASPSVPPKKMARKSTSGLKKMRKKGSLRRSDMGVRFLCVEDPEVCSRSYSSQKHLRSHIKTFHEVRKFVCEYEGCSARYESDAKLKSHVSKVHEKVLHTEICDVCGIKLPRKDMKKHYYLRHVGVGKFSCEICTMDFNDTDEFKNHEALHKKAEFPFSCVVCQKLFTNSLDLRSHVTSNHLSSGLKCEVCGIMKPNDFLLRRHMKVHEKVKTFSCPECDKPFSSKGYLIYHLEHNHENAGKRYPCEVCGKTFSHLKNVLRHKVVHQDEKPFKCNICPKRFNYSHLLKKHEEIHSNTKNYGCEICGKRFRQEQNLRQHMRSHRPKPEKQNPGKKNNATKHDQSQNMIVKDDGNMDLETLMDVKIESGSENAATMAIDPLSVEKPETVVSALSPTIQVNSSGEFILPPPQQAQPVHQIQLTLSPQHQPQQQGTTTVVIVTSDQNFQWMT